MAVLWAYSRTVKKGEYLYAVVPDHPRATANGYVLEHRIVAENHIGRLLGPDEVVHHKNGDKHDNRWRNLQVLTTAEHHAHHHPPIAPRPCEECGTVFTPRKNKGRFCSRTCSGTHNRRKVLASVAQSDERRPSKA